MRTMAWAFGGLLFVAGCAGDSGGAADAAATDGDVQDARSIDAAAVDPAGTHHTFVIASLNVPESAAEASMTGLDLDDRPNDGIDNQLAMMFGSLVALVPELDTQQAVDRQIDRGGIIMLANVKATGLSNASGVGLFTYVGADPNPSPCADANDQVCRRHLAGTAMFAVAAASPSDALVAGDLVDGRFSGGPGTAHVQLAFPGVTPIGLTLHNAKADLAAVSAAGWTSGKIGGAVLLTDLHAVLIPSLADSIRLAFDETCATMAQGGTMANQCLCTAGGSSEMLRGLFDKQPYDCVIANDEVDTVLSGFLTPDIDVSGDLINDALSVGFGVAAVESVFTPPGL